MRIFQLYDSHFNLYAMYKYYIPNFRLDGAFYKNLLGLRRVINLLARTSHILLTKNITSIFHSFLIELLSHKINIHLNIFDAENPLLVLKIRFDQRLLLDYQRDHLLRLLDKFFLGSRFVHGNDNFPSNKNIYLELAS